MNAEQRHRREIVLKGIKSPLRIACATAAGLGLLSIFLPISTGYHVAGAMLMLATGGLWYSNWVEDRKRPLFKYHPYVALWKTVVDRLERFEKAYAGVHGTLDDELPILKKKVLDTADTVFGALLRADVMRIELEKSEGPNAGAFLAAPDMSRPANDAKVQELYQLADRNMAEYRQRLGAVTSGIHRCEAQTTVFVTTLDNLRMRLLGYRLIGKSPEIEHQQFLDSIGSAKAELDAVDKALEELSFDRLVAQSELEMAVAPVEVSPTLEDRLNQVTAPPPLPVDAKIEDRPE